MRLSSQEEVLKVKRSGVKQEFENADSLDQILVKHKSKLEREKMVAAQQPCWEITQFSIFHIYERSMNK